MSTPTNYTDVANIVINHNDTAMTTSLKVAEVFGKRHDNVLIEIRKLIERGLLNFQESSYTNSQNKWQPMFLMDRFGFTMLVMGFTGDAAFEFKLKYVKAFDQMEQHIKQNQMVVLPNFNNPVEAARAWADQMEKRQALEAQTAVMAPKAEVYDAVVADKMMSVRKLIERGLRNFTESSRPSEASTALRPS